MNKNKKFFLLLGVIISVFCFGMLIETTFKILEYKVPEKRIDKDTVIDLTDDIGVIIELQRQGILDSVDNIRFDNIEIDEGRYFLKVKK